ncbi:MAG: hypothetical protein GXY65_16380 [Rhodococcus sp.]|uniref:hypothetical protein n=1 Tax=Rhodococcus TaxID=1827 RepID=UPI0016AD08E3|nr:MULTISPECIES: hypothetical protein [Rhodococcus]NLV80883.1 hypothetical protein [Rhodococcus sp. (in: high G+C Gram-positive bacteria)]
MSDNNGERRSFRGGGSTPRSDRDDNANRHEDRPRERRESGTGRDGGRSSDRYSRGDRPGGGGRHGGRQDRSDYNRSDYNRSGGRDDRAGTRDSRDRTERGNAERREYRGGRTDDRRSRDHDRPARSGGDRSGGDRSARGPERREGAPRRRGGEGGFDPARGGEGTRPQRKSRPEEPDLPEDVEATELDPTIRRDLLSLDKANANAVARHLVMAGRLLDDDPRSALAHARAARQRAGRIAVVREAAGVAAYHAGEWAEALSELRAARRMSGGTGLLAVMADCERGLGRPEKAIELGRSDEARALSGDEAAELRMVVAGARMDLGQIDQAVVTLQTADLDPSRTGTPAARLFYAYADALVAAGRTDEGLQWFLHAADADLDGVTDAEDRVDELTGGDL